MLLEIQVQSMNFLINEIGGQLHIPHLEDHSEHWADILVMNNKWELNKNGIRLEKIIGKVKDILVVKLLWVPMVIRGFFIIHMAEMEVKCSFLNR